MTGTALMAATGATMSLALFTSQTAVAGNVFTTGTIVLSVNPTSTIFTSTAMMPGDSVPTGPAGAPVTVSNTGTGDFRYAITGSSTDTDSKHLNTVLQITVRQPDTAGGSSCTAFTGALLFNGVVPTAGVNMVGDPSPGNQAGDRTLVAGTNETLCFKAALPIGTLIAFQGATSTYTFTFTAEQTANNP